MNTYSEYKEIKAKQDLIVDELSDKLNSYPRGEFGLVIESIRLSDEYRALKQQYTREFKTLQNIHTIGMKLFKKEIRKEYEDKLSKKK